MQSAAATAVKQQQLRQRDAALSSVLTRPSAKHNIGALTDDVPPPQLPVELAVDADPAFNRQWKWKTFACPLMTLVNVPLIVLDDYLMHRSLSLKIAIQLAMATTVISLVLICVESPLSCVLIRASARASHANRRSRRVHDEGPAMEYLRAASARRAPYQV